MDHVNILLSLKKWFSVYKHFVESPGPSMTVPKHPVQCSSPGVCKMVIPTLSEALGNVFFYCKPLLTPNALMK